MLAGIVAFGTLTVFPLVGFFLYRHRATAGIRLCVRLFGLRPLFLAGVVLRVQLAIRLTAHRALRFRGTGGFAAGVLAGIVAFGTLTVFPLVIFFLYRHRATAGIRLCVRRFGLRPPFFAGMILRV